MLRCGVTEEDRPDADYEDDVDWGPSLQRLGNGRHGHVKGVLHGGGRRGCRGQRLTGVHGVGMLDVVREGGKGGSGVGMKRCCVLHAPLIMHDGIYSVRCKRE